VVSSDSDASCEAEANEKGKKVTHTPYPCTHCGVTLSWKEYTWCMYSLCQAPFHKPHTGCANGDKVYVVDKFMNFCSSACAGRDRSGGVTASLSLSQPIAASASEPAARASSPAPSPSAAPPAAPADKVETSMALSQPVMQSWYSSKPNIACKSCLKPVQWNKGTGCAICYGYHHKVPRGGEGCTREGWQKGRSRNVDGNISCVECRFKKDPDWIRFCGARADDP
jgi:hypothetical protein